MWTSNPELFPKHLLQCWVDMVVYNIFAYDLPSLELQGPNLFQHRSAPVSKARSMKPWFAKVGLKAPEWPAHISDPNPTEPLWDEQERLVHARLPDPASGSDLTNIRSKSISVPGL